MITFSSEVNTELARDSVTPAILLTIDFPMAQGGALKLTDNAFDIDDFLASATFESADVIKLTSGVDRNQYGVVLNDNDNLISTRFENGYAGIPMNVAITFIDASGNVLSDRITIFDGVISAVQREITPMFIKLTVLGVSELYKTDLSKGIYTTSDSIKRLEPTDTSFDYVRREGQDNLRNWGRTNGV